MSHVLAQLDTMATMETSVRSGCRSRYIRRAPSIWDESRSVMPFGAVRVQPEGRFAVDEGQSLQGCSGGFGGAAFVASDATDVDAGAVGDVGWGKSGFFSGLDEGVGVDLDVFGGRGASGYREGRAGCPS